MRHSQDQDFLAAIHEHQRSLYKVCHVYCDRDEDVQDLFQDILLNVWKSRKSYRREAKLSTWLYRIAINTALTWIRNANRKIEQVSMDQGLLKLRVPFSDANQQERSEWLQVAIKQLNKIDRATILLFLEGYSYDEIAKTLGISSSNVGVKLNRIRQKLTNLAQNISL